MRRSCCSSGFTDARTRTDLPPSPSPDCAPEEIFRLLQEDATEFRESFWFMRWGEIVDNVSKYAYLDDELVVVFEFWRAQHPVRQDRGKVFVARLQPDEFATLVDNAADLMDTESR
jgi:hypothetical protein